MTQSHLHPVNNDSARFEAGSETVDNGNGTPPVPPSGSSGNSKREARARAEKALPHGPPQVRKIRSRSSGPWPATSGNNRRGSTAQAMSAAINLGSGTGGLNSRFFRSANWFESVGRGEYTASAGVLAYHQHITIDPDAQHEATKKMRDEVCSSWFWETLEPMLASGHPISIKLAILELAKAAGASSHTDQLETIVEWLEWVGLIVREGDQIRLRVTTEGGAEVQREDNTVEGVTNNNFDETEGVPSVDGDEVVPKAEPSTTSAAAVSPGDLDAIVSFNMSVRLTAADMKSLDREQRDFVLALAERLRG
ncbi:hypothetical protein [Nocardioides sp. B-3]|uniref:hypothetical protein n=1 Tax=Nocardioides sp. B-3 TaxID=2895565 RepID=UPI0021522695|nr:hypothetical protein [Nocardioides sp. B-3]UUZ57652.1 hypothetical protein LP418_14440 [Nocardioides sp. B-3]